MSACVVRTATKADAPAITSLLNHYIETSTSLFILEPQTLEERIAWLEERAEVHPAVVAEIDGTFVGWGALSVHNPRAGYRHSADTSVYVAPEQHRRGVGRAILHELIARARAGGHHTLIALCCTESTASIALHEAVGFTKAGELREVGRKFDRWLNIAHLQLML